MLGPASTPTEAAMTADIVIRGGLVAVGTGLLLSVIALKSSARGIA